jgi:hypothetical protein
MLSGCTAVSDLAARLTSDGRVEFLVCEPIDADRIRVVSALRSASDPEITYWLVSGLPPISEGFALTYGAAPDGAVEEAGPLALPKDEVVVLAESVDGTGEATDSVQGTFDPLALSSDSWRMADGRIMDDRPC